MNNAEYIQSKKPKPKNEISSKIPRKQIIIKPIPLPLKAHGISRNTRKDALGNLIGNDSKTHKVTFRDHISNENLVDISNISTEREHKICYNCKTFKYDTKTYYNILMTTKQDKNSEKNKKLRDFYFNNQNKQGKSRNIINDNAQAKCCSCVIF